MLLETFLHVKIRDMRALGTRIRRVRETMGRTQEQFALLIGVSRGAVGGWELGKGCSREHLRRISEQTGVSGDWLMSGPDEGPIIYLTTPKGQEMADIVADDALPFTDMVNALSWTLQAIDPSVSGDRAQVLAEAVTRAIRTRSASESGPLSRTEQRELVEIAVRLFPLR